MQHRVERNKLNGADASKGKNGLHIFGAAISRVLWTNLNQCWRSRRCVTAVVFVILLIYLIVFQQETSWASTRGLGLKTVRLKYVPSLELCDNYTNHSDTWITYNFSDVHTNVKRQLSKDEFVHYLQTESVSSHEFDISRKYINSDCDHFNISLDELCDEECQQFRLLLTSWSPDKPKAVIYYMTRLKTLSDLKRSLRLLELNFNKQFQYPVILFAEEDFMKDTTATKEIKLLTGMKVFFQQVTFKMPDHVKVELVAEKTCWQNVGYRHMCRFQAKKLYEQSILTGVDYALRLDDDSFFNKPIEYDLFKYMVVNNKTYGYAIGNEDHYLCVLGLWEAACNFAKRELLTVEFFNDWIIPNIYFNNFELSALSLWRSCGYQKFVDYIDRLGGIYYFRWGDAPIKTIAVSFFVPKVQIHQFTDIGYVHE